VRQDHEAFTLTPITILNTFEKSWGWHSPPLSKVGEATVPSAPPLPTPLQVDDSECLKQDIHFNVSVGLYLAKYFLHFIMQTIYIISAGNRIALKFI